MHYRRFSQPFKKKEDVCKLNVHEERSKSLHFSHCLNQYHFKQYCHYSGAHYHVKQYCIHGCYVDLVSFVPILPSCILVIVWCFNPFILVVFSLSLFLFFIVISVVVHHASTTCICICMCVFTLSLQNALLYERSK